jgi:flagellar biosynthesis GTPase FlhF
MGSTSPGEAGKAPLPDRWESTTATIGDVRVSISQVGEETTRVGNASVFAIRLSILNTSFSKRLTYQTWSQNATLRDNFGNAYNRLPRPKGVGVQGLPLDPTTPVIDTLLFELPIATAGNVVLHLPGSNVGQQEAFNLRMNLVTSGARLDAVTRAAAAAEAEAKAKAAAIAAKEAEAERAAREATERKRILELEAEKDRRADEAKKKADEEAAERTRRADEARKKVEAAQAAERKRVADREAEIASLERKLATARADKKTAESRLKELKETAFAASTKKAQQEVERLTAEIADLEAKITSMKKTK